MKFREGNVFTGVCLLTGRGQGIPGRGLGIHGEGILGVGYTQGWGRVSRGYGIPIPSSGNGGHCGSRYASYWNAFLFQGFVRIELWRASPHWDGPAYRPIFIGFQGIDRVQWLIHIAGLGLGFGLGFQTPWVHCTMQKFSHWLRSRSRSLLRWFPKWLLYPF